MKHNTKRITDFLEKIDWMFELNNYSRKIIDCENENGEVAADITVDTTYKSLIIKLYPPFWELNLNGQRETLIHELVHSLLVDTKVIASDLLNGKLRTYDEITKLNEQATTMITHLLVCLMQNKLQYAKKAYKDYLK